MDESAVTPPAAATGRSRRILVGFASVAIILAGLTVALGLSRLIGGWFRDNALVTQERPAPDVALAYADAPDAGPFFDARDTVTVVVPWDMTVADFLAFYHLQNNPDARRALREQLDAGAESDRLREGAEVSFYLTARRGTREQ